MSDPRAAVNETRYGPCPTRLDNQPTPSDRPWRYGHAASVEGAHWDIYAGDGIDGWLVGMVATEADAALIVDAVNAHRCYDEAALAEALATELMKAGYHHRFYTASGEEHTRTDAAGYAAAIIARLRGEK